MSVIELASQAVFKSEGAVRQRLVEGQVTRVVLLCMEPGQAVPAHSHPGCEVSLHCLSGSVVLSAPGEERLALRAGEMALVDGAGRFAPRNEGQERAQLLIHLVNRKRS